MAPYRSHNPIPAISASNEVPPIAGYLHRRHVNLHRHQRSCYMYSFKSACLCGNWLSVECRKGEWNSGLRGVYSMAVELASAENVSSSCVAIDNLGECLACSVGSRVIELRI